MNFIDQPERVARKLFRNSSIFNRSRNKINAILLCVSAGRNLNNDLAKQFFHQLFKL